MNVTFLDHSGFAVTTETAVMVFDYYRDPSHSLKKILDGHAGLPVVFMVSHRHPDHFNPDIFNLAQNHRRTYLLSDDILSRFVPQGMKAQVTGVHAGDTISGIDGGLVLHAFGSTDEGCSFVVDLPDGRKVFHAGDLNDWHWAEASTPGEAKRAEQKFVVEVERIARSVSRVDVAMFPVDNRMGTSCGRGAQIFTQAVEVANFFPMHFGGLNPLAACDFPSYIQTPDTKCHCLHTPGASATV